MALAGLAFVNLTKCAIIQNDYDQAQIYIQQETDILKEVGVWVC